MLEENNTVIFRYASLFLARSNKKKEISYWKRNEEANSTNKQSWKVDSNTSFHGTRVAWLKSMGKKSRVLSWIHSIIVTAAPAMPHRVRLVRHRISIYFGSQTNSASLHPIVSTQWLIPRFRPGKIFREGEFFVRFKKIFKNLKTDPTIYYSPFCRMRSNF